MNDQGIDHRTERPLVVGYTAGALRVTTDANSVTTGPRAHVTGLIGGLRDVGVEVNAFVAGDHVPARFHGETSDGLMRSGNLRGYAVDALRLASNPVLGVRSRRAVGDVDLFYERQATFQTLGFYRRSSVPWVVESNGPFWYEASSERGTLRLKGAARRLELACYARASAVSAVSSLLRDIIVEEAKIDGRKVIVVPNAVDLQRIPEIHRTPPNDTLTVGFLGHVIRWAGLDTLIEAVREIRLAGYDVRVVIVGTGPAMVELREMTRRMGLGDSVSFLGLRPWHEIPALLATFDVGYSGQKPMAIGGMYHSPVKLYEYGAASLPIVASDHPDARALIGRADSGWLFPSGDVGALAAALRTSCERAGDLPAIGARGREEVRQRHTWQARATYLLKQLHEMGLIADSVSIPDSRLTDYRQAAGGVGEENK